MTSPSVIQEVWINFDENSRISGDAFVGIYESEITIPAYAEVGEWTVRAIQTQDSAGNNEYRWNGDSSGGDNEIPEDLRLRLTVLGVDDSPVEDPNHTIVLLQLEPQRGYCRGRCRLGVSQP